MINRKDLRIGNFVELNGEIKPVEAIGYDKISVIGRYWLDDQLNPIPLTEEILIKCGFEKEETIYYFPLELSKFYIRNPYKGSNIWRIKTDPENTIAEVCFLHQLQNLYFALTGQELTYLT